MDENDSINKYKFTGKFTNFIFVDSSDSYNHCLGYLPQSFGCYPNFTGWDFMIYLSSIKGLAKDLAEKRSKELLKLVGFYDVRNKKL